MKAARSPRSARAEGLRVLPFSLGGRRFAVLVEDLRTEELPSALTTAERDIAGLVRRGLTNRQIAERRGTSLRTVANQMAGLMRKLGAESRVQLALRLSAPRAAK